MTNEEIEEIIIEATERIVIDYANFSGRESKNRSAFRLSTNQTLENLAQAVYQKGVEDGIKQSNQQEDE